MLTPSLKIPLNFQWSHEWHHKIRESLRTSYEQLIFTPLVRKRNSSFVLRDISKLLVIVCETFDHVETEKRKKSFSHFQTANAVASWEPLDT